MYGSSKKGLGKSKNRIKRKDGIITTKGAFEKDYTLTEKVLGRGSYAEVRVGIENESSRRVAVKILFKSGMSAKDKKKVYKEVNILKGLRHQNVVKVYEAYEEKTKFLIVMEFVGGGELFSKIVEEKLLSEDKIKPHIVTIARALSYCWKQGIVHRDIKPENILLTTEEEGGFIKIADFNLSRQLKKDEIKFSVMETQCGTPNYVAPEVLSGFAYNFKCDVWSLGVILFVMLSGGYLPFSVDEEAEDPRDDLLEQVREANWSFVPPEAWAGVSAEAKNLVTNLMNPDPKRRYNYEELLAHPWFAKKNDNAVKLDALQNLEKKHDEKRKQVLSSTFMGFEDESEPGEEATKAEDIDSEFDD